MYFFHISKLKLSTKSLLFQRYLLKKGAEMMQESGISLKDVRAVYRALQMMSQVAEKRA